MSGLSLYDRALLSATYYYHWDDRLNCERAYSEIVKRTKDPETAKRIVQSKFGCETVTEKPKVVIDGFGFHSCLCKFQHPLFGAYLDLSRKMEVGILPDRGSYMDQPAQVLEGIQLISRIRSEIDATASAKQAKESNHGR